MSDDLPFKAEYAKSGRAACKKCKTKINQGSLRMAVMVQSPHFDGKIPQWFHLECFVKKIPTSSDIAHFDSLRWEDQEKIKAKIGELGAPKKGAAAQAELNEYSIEYSKTSRSACKGCDDKIPKGMIRIAKKEVDGRFGEINTWHHVDCFTKNRIELDFYYAGDKIEGFNTLGEEDQAMVKKKLPDIHNAIKRKLGSDDAPNKKQKVDEDSKLKEQNKIIFGYRDKIQQLKKKELQELLEYNDQEVPTGLEVILDHIADRMAFGTILPCEDCKSGPMSCHADGYHCRGNVTEWTKCIVITKTPKRKPFEIPEKLKEHYDFLKKYKYVKRDRLFSDFAPSSTKSSADSSSSNKEGKPLNGCKLVVEGKLSKANSEIKEIVEGFGGKILTKITSNVLAVISNEESVAKMTKKIAAAKDEEVFVVTVDFLDEVGKGTDIEQLLNAKKISSWNGKIEGRYQKPGPMKSAAAAREEKKYTKSMPSSMTMTVKGGAAVEPDSGLECVAHVLQEKADVYSTVLNMVDIQRGTNSYYKLQLLEGDKTKRYWLYRAWGRVGTTIGNNKCEKYDSKEDAKDAFLALYEEKTGNKWKNRKHFVKQSSRFYPIDLDFGQEDEAVIKMQNDNGVQSRLDKAVQELIKMLFDVESMKAAMVEFEIDLTKMPLGKLSRKQIENAFTVLNEAQQLVQNGDKAVKILDVSNRFYTLIPHDFGLKKPTVLDSIPIIQSKIDMLNNLLDIEIAYNLLKSADKSSKDKNVLDIHYESLKTKINVLDKKSKEFDYISQYLKNTHAATHNQYTLKIEEVFKIDRKGERTRYRPFQKLHNRQLLWHGSRTTNFCGILSQGLRIAPPEAPVTGYMFGKGIYFADMVSKSANYCFTNKKNPTGILLLCEVALGNMHELTNADYIEKLPAGKHSTKGIGKTQPNPSNKMVLEDGLEIPLGKGVDVKMGNTSLLYNEYIVYDVSQVNIKYLIKTHFNHKF